MRRHADAGARAHAGERRGEPRVRDQLGKLVVDYRGLAHELKQGLTTEAARDKTERPCLFMYPGRNDAGRVS
ncbi:MAG: hypothetical protein B7Z66_12140 [Chromatiales bacterium 21-64-14]|nr:MAG: hypothetical protein B7Z66_12140 [Chromatiales bacterium 21-64-14]